MKNNYLIYKKITESFLNNDTKRIVKVAFSNALASVERFFLKYFNCDLNMTLDDNSINLFYSIYPKFELFSIDEINELIKTIRLLRNECAHFNISKNVCYYGNSTILEKIKSIQAFKFLATTDDGDITLYGMFVLSSLFLDVRSIDQLVNNVLYDPGIEIDFYKGFRTDRYHIRSYLSAELKHYSCINKDYQIQFISSIITGSKPELIDYNSTCRRQLANIFFELESSLNNTDDDFSTMIKKIDVKGITNYVMDDIIFLRNCWFHGVQLGDIVSYDDCETEFSFDLILPILSKMNKVFAFNNDFLNVVEQIEIFSYEIFETKFKRFFILAHQIINRDAIDLERLNDKINKSNVLCSRVMTDDYFLKTNEIKILKELLNDKTYKMVLFQNKFIDKIRRIIRFDGTMTILHFVSNSKIKIDNFETDFNEIYLVDIFCKNKAFLNDYNLDQINKNKVRLVNNSIGYIKIEI